MSALRHRRPLRCARCGGEEWLRDGDGHRVCATCAGGDARVAAPPAFVSPEAASSAVPAPAGPEEPLIGAARLREERLEQLKAWARRETLLHDLDALADVLEGRTA